MLSLTNICDSPQRVLKIGQSTKGSLPKLNKHASVTSMEDLSLKDYKNGNSRNKSMRKRPNMTVRVSRSKKALAMRSIMESPGKKKLTMSPAKKNKYRSIELIEDVFFTPKHRKSKKGMFPSLICSQPQSPKIRSLRNTPLYKPPKVIQSTRIDVKNQ